MNLKQAFRHQNSISNAINTLTSYIYNPDNVCIVTQTHKKNSAVSTKEDEVVVAERQYEHSADEICFVIAVLLFEKQILTKQVYLSKLKLDFDIDGELSMNVAKRSVIESLKSMNRIKEKTRTVQGYDYTFNVEGNQIRYQYDIETTSKPDFDREEIKKTIKLMEKDVETISEKIDVAHITAEVDYNPLFGDTDSIEDIISSILSTRKKAN